MEGYDHRNLQVVRSSLRQNPLTRKTSTDLLFIIPWIIIVVMWIFAIFYVLHYHGDDDSFATLLKRGWYARDMPSVEFIIIEPILGAKASLENFFKFDGVIICGGLSLIFTSGLFFLILGRYVPHYCCHVGVTMEVVVLLLSLFQMKIWSSNGFIKNKLGINWFNEFIVWTQVILQTVFASLALYCMAKTGIGHIPEFVRDTTRVYFRFPLLILFGICVHGLAVVVILISLVALAAGRFYGFWPSFIFIGGYYLVNTLYYYNVAVISKVAASWNWTENRSKNPNALVFQSVTVVTRFQFGTISFAATGIGPLIALCKCLGRSRERINVQPKSMLDHIMDIPLSIYLILNITTYSLMVNSIHKKSFNKSIISTLRSFRRSSSRSISFLRVFSGIMTAATLIVTLALPLIVRMFWLEAPELDGLYYAILVLMMPLYSIVYFTGPTNYLCTVEDGEEINDPNAGVYAIPMTEMPMPTDITY